MPFLFTMQLTNFSSEAKYSSRYLVEQINLFRKDEGNTTELLHKNFLAKIENEFEEEINGLKIYPVEMRDQKGEMRKVYELNFEQSLQMLMSESKSVRKCCVEVMKKQQQEIQSLTPKLPSTYLEALKELVIKEEENQKLLTENVEQKHIIQEQAPKVEFYDQVADTTTSFDMQEVSAMLKLSYGRNVLFRKLRDAKILMSDNLPYRSLIDEGKFIVVESRWVNPKTEQATATTQTRITQKGLDWLQKSKFRLGL